MRCRAAGPPAHPLAGATRSLLLAACCLLQADELVNYQGSTTNPEYTSALPCRWVCCRLVVQHWPAVAALHLSPHPTHPPPTSSS